MVETTPVLSVRNLKTYFNTDEGIVKAVDGISFDVFEGKTLGIVGESGCGKSTVGRTILQILDSNAEIIGGEVLLRTKDEAGFQTTLDLVGIEPYSEQMRQIQGQDIALIFQEPMTSFSPVHTLGNQLREMILLHNDVSKKEANDRAIELLGQVGVPYPERRLQGYVWELSGGLRQRAMIAMAISNNPKVLIADEPTTSLDVTTQAQILDLLGDLQDKRGMAIVLITHNLGVIAEMTDDVLVMYLGRPVEEGPVDDLFHAPKHPYTQALLRSIPSIQAKGRERLPAIAGTIPHPFNRPSGCPFHPRCTSYMEGVCEKKEPEFLPIGDNQHVSCFLHHGNDGGAAAEAPSQSE